MGLSEILLINNKKIEELLDDVNKLDKPDRSLLYFVLGCIITLLCTAFASDIESIKDNLIEDIENEKNIENEENLQENFFTDVLYLANRDKNHE